LKQKCNDIKDVPSISKYPSPNIIANNEVVKESKIEVIAIKPHSKEKTKTSSPASNVKTETPATEDKTKSLAKTDKTNPLAKTEETRNLETDKTTSLAKTDKTKSLAKTEKSKSLAKTDKTTSLAKTDKTKNLTKTNKTKALAKTDKSKTLATAEIIKTPTGRFLCTTWETANEMLPEGWIKRSYVNAKDVRIFQYSNSTKKPGKVFQSKKEVFSFMKNSETYSLDDALRFLAFIKKE